MPLPVTDEAETPPLRILRQDAHFVAVSKPSGLLVHRGPESDDTEFLLQRLRDQVGAWLYPVHRLDRGTSGVIVFGLSSPAAASLQTTLATSDTRKEYLVLARRPWRGHELPDEFRVERPLTDDDGVPREARTDFEVVETYPRCALLRARLHTGRRHQIRRHLAHWARHVLGDSTYGKGRINAEFRKRFGLGRLFLHACRLSFRHPVIGEPVDLQDPLPNELTSVLQRLRDYRAEWLSRAT